MCLLKGNDNEYCRGQCILFIFFLGLGGTASAFVDCGVL